MDKKRYFDTFDALRFFGFLCVFMAHINFGNFPLLGIFERSGSIALSFFFVLSGFLITYILLYEKINTTKIALKPFFARRLLRAWPLFFAMILFAFLTPYILQLIGLGSSSEGYDPNWLLSCLFLENYKMMLTHSFPNVSPLRVMWSLCVEEHFYLIWGFAFYFAPLKKIPVVIGTALIAPSIIRLVYGRLGLPFLDIFTNLDFFAWGAIPAYWLFRRQSIIERIGQLPYYFKYIIVILTLYYVFFSAGIVYPYQGFIDPLLSGCLLSTLILFTLPDTGRLFVRASIIPSRLGRYTYGLYLFHTIFISLLLQVFKKLGFDIGNVMIFGCMAILALALSIGTSMLSYRFFEFPFLRFKKYFEPTSL